MSSLVRQEQFTYQQGRSILPNLLEPWGECAASERALSLVRCRRLSIHLVRSHRFTPESLDRMPMQYLTNRVSSIRVLLQVGDDPWLPADASHTRPKRPPPPDAYIIGRTSAGCSAASNGTISGFMSGFRRMKAPRFPI